MSQSKFINGLQKGRVSDAIIVRVVRKWTHYENQGQGPPLFVGMVIADAKVLPAPDVASSIIPAHIGTLILITDCQTIHANRDMPCMQRSVTI
jgi:hypothetical protein